MNWWRKAGAVFRALFRKQAMDREMSEEMRSHIELLAQENMEAGMSPEQARFAAMKEFGSLESLQETCREQRGVAWVETLGSDIRFASRMLLKNPGFAAVAILTLALGIGATSAMYSVVNAVLLRPLPYPEADRLVSVCESNLRQGWSQYVTSLGAYTDWRRENSVFDNLAAATVLGPATARLGPSAELVHVGAVSAGFFPLLGAQPLLGRQFVAAEENPAHGDVVLLSETLWRRSFGGDPNVLNRSIRLADRQFRVVGIIPATVRLFDPAGVQGW
ncbi:MAG TPA: ABC transporter permease, partial [Verrucomicrobiae bacterium]|nr:ABC transporter permease [Verrucomicrobiae bacterium]